MGGFVESAMDVVGKPFEWVAGGVESVGGAVADVGQSVAGAIDENMETIVLLAAAAMVTYGALNPAVLASLSSKGIPVAMVTEKAATLTPEVASQVLATSGGVGSFAANPELAAFSASLGAGGSAGYGLAGAGMGLGTALGITAGGQVLSAGLGYKAAGKAAEIGAASADRAIQAQLQMYYQSRADLAPWREAGGEALTELQKQVMGGPGEFVPSEQPGYKFGYEEFVEKPLLAGASATGKLRSGEVLKSLSDRAQNYASLSYDSWLNRWLTKMQPLQSLAGVGQTSASTTAQLGAQTGQGIAQTTMAGGAAQQAGVIGQANALTGGIKAGTGTLLDALIMNKVYGGNLFGGGG